MEEWIPTSTIIQDSEEDSEEGDTDNQLLTWKICLEVEAASAEVEDEEPEDFRHHTGSRRSSLIVRSYLQPQSFINTRRLSVDTAAIVVGIVQDSCEMCDEKTNLEKEKTNC